MLAPLGKLRRIWLYLPLFRASMPISAISLDFISGFLLKAMFLSDAIYARK